MLARSTAMRAEIHGDIDEHVSSSGTVVPAPSFSSDTRERSASYTSWSRGFACERPRSSLIQAHDNHRVQMFDKNGLFVGKFGTNGHGPGQLHNPLFIAVNNANHQVYVSDSSNHRICVFDVQGMFLFSFGTEGFHGGQFKFPRGVAVDSQ
ncbi:NHL repeat protein, partial [Teladorsagia circumcincta]